MAPLLERLREIEDFPASHAAVTGDVLDLVGKLAAFIDHGEELFAAAERDREARAAGQPTNNIAELLTPPAEDAAASSAPAPAAEPLAPAAAPTPVPEPPAEDPQARIDRLRQELITAEAQLQRTQVADAATAPPATPDTAPPPPAPAPEV